MTGGERGLPYWSSPQSASACKGESGTKVSKFPWVGFMVACAVYRFTTGNWRGGLAVLGLCAVISAAPFTGRWYMLRQMFKTGGDG